MLTGGCHCGAIRYEVSGPARRHSLCHCRDCRRSAGAPLVGWAAFRADDIRLTTGTPRDYASSADGRRHFCERCGTGLFYTNPIIFPGEIDLQTATLDDPDAVIAPSAQIQVADRIGWMKGAHALPEFARFPDA
ncbi:GFA family protein [Sphingosinicella sp. LHD-64]|uniref:GFA family protein n=1 Tax=Sphingosinicella sp. LHD-64 TaxID=3072139 RepID=UPI00280D55B4|nr:GFA family protein [Sphingosinicella sp. LHD-64]MDQ8755508.1 GFA family protein [Sphingosinicella sp. LHD-64]